MSGAPQRGHQGGRNKRGRGGASFGRGTQRWSHDRNYASNGGAEVQLNLQAERGRARGSRGRSRGRGIGRGGNFFRNESATENGERFGLNHDQGRGRGTSGRSRDEMRISSGRNIQGNGSDNESEGAWGPLGRQRGTFRGSTRGGRSRDTNADEQLDYKSLSSMLIIKEPDELVLDLTSDRYFPAFESLLSQHDLPDKKVVVILKIFARACDSETSRTFLIRMLNKLVSSVYLSCELTRYINCLGYSARDDERDLDNELMCMVKVFTELLKRLPTSFPNLPLPNLLHATNALMKNDQLCDEVIKSSVNNLIALKDEMAEKVKKEVEVKANKPKRRQPGDEALLDNEDPPENYRFLNVIPEGSDVHPTEPVFFRRNKVEGSYDGPEHYLDVQFRLLREDFMRPLREGIASLTESIETGGKKKSQDIRVYSGVKILDPVCTSKGVIHEISFDVSKLNMRVQWKNSKRLIYGSLLCLSRDNFETFLLATVETREEKQLKQGILQVRFTDVHADFGKETYQMVETTAYFEAYRHVLEGLQEIRPYNFPFERYIVKSETDVQVPLYLRNTSKDVTYDLTCIMRSQSERSTGIEYHSGQQAGKSVRILDVNSWPSAEDLGLDDSQLKAVQLALTKEFAIIQGPPGTGKTYIGLKVVKALLKNKIHWHYRIASTLEERRFWETKLRKRPLLLVCYTNHALDQFLEGIQKFHPEGIVRVGGQSRSRELEECNLRSIKQAIREYHKEVCRYHRRLRQRELRKKSGRYHYNRFGGYSYYDDSTDEEYEDEEEELEYPEISSELLEIYNNQYWIRSKFKELYQELNITSQQLQHINFSIQKTKTTVINENQLLSEGHMSIENYNSIVARFKEADGMKIKVKPDAMHYWLKLLTNTSELIESGSSFVSPVAVYPLSAKSSRSNTLNSSEKLVFHNATPAFGIDEQPNHSFRIAENDSYILIPNMENSLLDTRFSITILLYVYTVHFSSSGSKGPILTFHQDGNIGIQIRQEGHVLSVTFNSRDGLLSNSLVTDAVLEWNEWNYIAVSYDYGTGILRVYHNGQMVKEQQNASMEIASHMPIHIGSLDLPDDKSSFYGLVSSLQFYPEAISQKQIKAIAGIPEEDSKEIEKPLEEDNEEPAKASDERQVNIVFEADAMEGLRRLDVDVDDVYYSQSLRQDLDVSSYEPHYAAQGEWEMQCSKFTKKRVKQLLDREMAKTDMMTDDEAKNVTDVWKISQQDKWRLYRYWIEKMREPYKTKARRLYPKFEECAERLKALQGQEDLTILEKATIIGMTTTGAAKFRGLIQKTKPCITIVEEAAEVLESHIVTSLNPGCQHLILIGDHQQLRPSPNVYELAKDYKLDVSLFERMVINRLDYQTLHKQRRMRPEIARMMRPIYDNLENHESVLNFENIKGVNKNIFFIEHNELEDFVEEGRSRSNIHEARYLAALCRYFILQGYDQERITILTMYTGQLIQLKKEMPKEFFGGVRICAVDNFQGEENDIILLSLVRSNEEENIGFLRISNRVCVALSRARKGFYCIGNLELICKKDKLWAKIIEDMRERGNVGRSLTLVCRNHPSTIIHASKRDDFQRAPQGGCTLPCHARLDCGHACRLRCHPTDTDHTEYECLEPCTKTLCDLGHKCKKRCFDNCGVCRVPRDKIMPACNHIQNLPCYVEPASVKCGVSCEVLKCGHPCAGSCGNCVQGRLHLLCQQNCERTLVCGHKCTENCAKKCPPCSRKCENECVHKKCPNKCCEPCTPCLKMCAWKCEHFKCTMRCCEPCDRPRCNNPCEKTLKCGHPCIGMCGEPCPNKCRVCHKDIVTKNVFGSEDDPEARFVELQPCGHVIEVNAMDALVDECNSGVTLKLQLKGCPICKTPIRTCPRYGNIIKNTLDDIEKVKEKLVSSNNGIKGEAKKLKSMIYFSEKFKNNAYYIQRKLDAKFLSKESLKMFQNQVIFLNLLSKMLAEISNSERDSRNAQGQNRLLKDSLEKEITALKTRGIPLTNEWHSYGMSDQAQEDLRNEILRVQLIVTYRILNGLIQEREAILNDRDEDDMNLIGQAIDSGKCIDEEKRKQHMQTLERIRRSCGMLRRYEYSPITKEDTMEITNGIGFTQGNWFKCPLGHTYSTDGEDCPECFQQWSRVIRR